MFILAVVVLLGTVWVALHLFARGGAAVARGRVLYDANCAACHGGNLEGQPDWQSAGSDGRLPALPHDATGHTWHHSDADLTAYIALGCAEALAQMGVTFDSAMPGFGDVLSTQEIADILAYIKSHWTERERQVSQLLLRGYSSKSIARELKIAPGTVMVHKRNVFSKLGISSQFELFSLLISALESGSQESRRGA